jgi:hypothetical protein
MTVDTTPLARRLIDRRERAIIAANHIAAQTDGRSLNPVEDGELDDWVRVASNCTTVLGVLSGDR